MKFVAVLDGREQTIDVTGARGEKSGWKGAAGETPPAKVRLKVADPITADEVISVHEILAGWSGDFTDLLQAEPDLKPPS